MVMGEAFFGRDSALFVSLKVLFGVIVHMYFGRSFWSPAILGVTESTLLVTMPR